MYSYCLVEHRYEGFIPSARVFSACDLRMVCIVLSKVPSFSENEDQHFLFGGFSINHQGFANRAVLQCKIPI